MASKNKFYLTINFSNFFSSRFNKCCFAYSQIKMAPVTWTFKDLTTPSCGSSIVMSRSDRRFAGIPSFSCLFYFIGLIKKFASDVILQWVKLTQATTHNSSVFWCWSMKHFHRSAQRLQSYILSVSCQEGNRTTASVSPQKFSSIFQQFY